MSDILKQITTYGLSIVISGIVLYAGLQFLNLYIKKFKNSIEAQDKKHDELLLLRQCISQKVDSTLEKAMLRSGASRALIFEYHNGLVGLGGLPFLRMSNTYEVIDEGSRSTMASLENLSCSLYASLVEALEEDTIVILDLDKRNPDISPIVYETLVQLGVARAMLCRFTNGSNRTIGFAALAFDVGNTRLENMSANDDVVLGEVAIEVGVLLSVK